MNYVTLLTILPPRPVGEKLKGKSAFCVAMTEKRNSWDGHSQKRLYGESMETVRFLFLLEWVCPVCLPASPPIHIYTHVCVSGQRNKFVDC